MQWHGSAETDKEISSLYCAKPPLGASSKRRRWKIALNGCGIFITVRKKIGLSGMLWKMNKTKNVDVYNALGPLTPGGGINQE